jgi:hypothetical protein
MAQQIGPRLGSGKMAEAFHYGDHVLKLYRDPSSRSVAFGEAAILAIVGEHGLPTPAVHEAGPYAGRWGLVMDRAPGQPLASLATADPALLPAALEAMVSLHLAIHARTEVRLSPLKPRLAERLRQAPGLVAALREALLARLAELPAGTRLCHGDFHPFNIIGPPGRGDDRRLARRHVRSACRRRRALLCADAPRRRPRAGRRLSRTLPGGEPAGRGRYPRVAANHRRGTIGGERAGGE